ncbi:MAG: hypothetical protein QOE14_920 [Humisphaera sp.]|nr:hypothetical protein [Humisphaera sp.]
MKTSRILHRAIIETLESRRLLSLTAPVSYAAGSGVTGIATGDLNGDGRSDVVVPNMNGPDGNHVSVLLSNANGTLQAAQQFATGNNPNSVAVGDVNNDGKRDIVTANYAGNLSVLLGNGNGTFQAPLNVTLPPQAPAHPQATTSSAAQTPQSVVVGDLNADGKLDLCVGASITFAVPYFGYFGYYDRWYTQGHVNTLLGNGNGTFGTTRTVMVGSAAPSVALGDFNNDNKLDVQSTSLNAPTMMLGNGDGSLQTAVFVGAWGSKVTSADFDMDGKRDLIVGDGATFTFLKGQGNGTFAAQGQIPVHGTIRSVVTGDMNGDGKLDLVATTTKTTFESYGYYGGYNPTTSESTKVLLGNGNGTFSRGVSSTTATYAGEAYPSPPNTSALVDVNSDARPDVVATDPRNNKLLVQLNEPGWIIPGTLSISDAAAVTEGNTGTVNAVFTVTLADAPAANVTVKYDIVDYAATLAGGDYVASSGTLTFTPGQTTRTIAVQVRGDRVGEYDEEFFVRLTDATNAEIIDNQGTGTIVDDEPRVISFTGGTVAEGNSGTVPLTYTMTLSAASDAPVTVSYVTIDSSAVAATDFVPVTGTLTFAPGQTTRTFTVQVKGDLIAENQEQLLVNLTGSTNALIAITAQAAGTITDTDPNPSISISNVSRAEGNSGQTAYEFVVSLSSVSEKEIWVNFATASGTAVSSGTNKDYIANSGTFTVYRGQKSTSLVIYVNGDTRSESDETFVVNLTQPNNVTIADSQGVATIINDETRGKRWVGPLTGGSWSTASNWSPSGVPVSTSLVRIDNGAAVTASASVTVSELLLTNTSTLTVATHGSRVLRTGAFFIDDYYSSLNLNDNDMIIDYTPGNASPLGGWNGWAYNGVTAMIGWGSNYGAWDGLGGIVTTRPDAIVGLTTLGVGEASQVLGLTGAQTALFSGQTVDATSVLVKYTYAGDANLDGIVSADDYSSIDFNFGTGASGWNNGDFNYDGIISGDDYSVIDFNIGAQGARL